jgi:membrane protease YdiL (CAAX protease family)
VALPSADRVRSDEVRWGMGDAFGGVLFSLLLSVIVATVAYTALDVESFDDLPLWGTALLQVPLWLALLGVPLAATHLKGRRSLRTDFGLDVRARDVPVGLGLGIALQVVIGLLLESLYPLFDLDLERVGESADAMAERADSGVGVVLLVLIAAIGAPLFEELFYRGLFLRAVQRRLGDVAAVALPALVFGLVHFQPYDFVALVLFGMAMGVVTLRTGRLGVAIWAHVAFNGTALLALLA